MRFIFKNAMLNLSQVSSTPSLPPLPLCLTLIHSLSLSLSHSLALFYTHFHSQTPFFCTHGNMNTFKGMHSHTSNYSLALSYYTFFAYCLHTFDTCVWYLPCTNTSTRYPYPHLWYLHLIHILSNTTDPWQNTLSHLTHWLG